MAVGKGEAVWEVRGKLGEAGRSTATPTMAAGKEEAGGSWRLGELGR